MHFFLAAELRSWLEQAGLSKLSMSACACLSPGWEEMLSQIRCDDVKWNELLRIELEACAEEGCLDMGTHLICAARKSSRAN
jgi:hypothetical protein